MASYGINIGLVALAISAARTNWGGIGRLLAAGARSFFSPLPLAVAILLAVASMAAMVHGAVRPYWFTPGWSELPKLPSGVDRDGRHWIGARSPRLEIVEFSDYECPHCRKAHKKMRLLTAEHPDEVRFYHRHLPLDRACHPGLTREFHRRACHFAKAAECAGEQGRFWEMNDALFATQDRVKSRDVDVNQLAVLIGLDRSTFKQCMRGERAMARVSKDLESAIERKLTATPTYLIGERKFVGGVQRAEFLRAFGTSTVGGRKK
jgi:protein-disulfide isomerase